MKILLYPFYSQQDKKTLKFIPEKCCVTKINLFLAESFVDAGHTVGLIIPEGPLKWFYGMIPYRMSGMISLFPVPIPLDNKDQRRGLPQEKLEEIILDPSTAPDLIISSHELGSTFLRETIRKSPKKIGLVQFNHLMPIGEWDWMKDDQIGSWSSADMVVVLSEILAAKIRSYTNGAVEPVVWPMCFSERYAKSKRIPTYPQPRDIDILFVQRCSQTNYTRHLEFLGAVRIMREEGYTGRIVVTDPTGYLESTKKEEWEGVIEFAHAVSSRTYWNLLERSKYIFAAMKDDLHGGIAMREAIYKGAVPIVSDNPAYQDLLGSLAHSYKSVLFFKDDEMGLTPRFLANHLRRIILGRYCQHKALQQQLKIIAAGQTFEGSWNTAVRTLAERNLLKI